MIIYTTEGIRHGRTLWQGDIRNLLPKCKSYDLVEEEREGYTPVRIWVWKRHQAKVPKSRPPLMKEGNRYTLHIPPQTTWWDKKLRAYVRHGGEYYFPYWAYMKEVN